MAVPARARASPPELLRALQLLDRLLERALAHAEELPAPAVDADAYRGLYISREELEPLLAREPGAALLGPPPEQRAPGDVAPRLRLVAERLELEREDEWLLLVALAVELDLRYERLFAYLQDDVTRRRPTVDLALGLLAGSPEQRLRLRCRLDAAAPLVRERVLELVPDPHQVRPPFLAHYLAPDEGMLRFLLDDPGLDPRLPPGSTLERAGATAGEVRLTEEARAALGRLVRDAAAGARLRLVVHGPPGVGRGRVAAALAAELGAPLLRAKLGGFEAEEAREVLSLLVRESRLRGALLCLEGAEAQLELVRAALEQALPAAVLLLPGPPTPVPGWVELELPAPGYTERRSHWRTGLSGLDPRAADELAARFRLTPIRIADAVAIAADRARLRGAAAPDAADLFAAARALSAGDLGVHARKLEPRFGWTDIVLPPDPRAQLQELCARASFRHVVYDDWGFDAKLSLGRGLNALFSGPPGTGKTMAAEVIARELRLELYAIDLSQIVSKYIGETEKNLHRIFEAARTSSAILFFDEADALFGRRSEVKDAHDRYANVEIAYLLQKMEAHEGIVILASNLRQNIDEAFLRRLDHVVEFPFPDEEHRRRIWETLFPAQAPLADDVDFALLARELRLAGGSIKNVALAAAFAAASDGGRIGVGHLERAARREYMKLGRAWTETSWR